MIFYLNTQSTKTLETTLQSPYAMLNVNARRAKDIIERCIRRISVNDRSFERSNKCISQRVRAVTQKVLTAVEKFLGSINEPGIANASGIMNRRRIAYV